VNRDRNRTFVQQSLASLTGCQARLTRSVDQLASLLPIPADALADLTPEQQDLIDAFLKRFEQVLITLQDQVFRGIALLEGHDPGSMSRRDLVELMERVGALDSATRFRDQIALRNRLAHTYPHDPARQAMILNAAYAAAADLLATAARSEQLIHRAYGINKQD
jgi:uncharacterized protein YutE (UPF0331/DUF86 family)